MRKSPRRARFQIHVSTAIVMMFVAGGLIWANVRGTVSDFDDVIEIHTGETEHEIITEFGWPCNALTAISLTFSRGEKLVGVAAQDNWTFTHAAADVFAALAILFAVWFICEWFIRRRAAGKGP